MNQNIIFTKLNADLFPFLAKSLPGRTSRFYAFLDLYERWDWDRKTVMIFLKSLQKMGVTEIKREYRRVTVHVLNLAISPPDSVSKINEDST